MRSWDQDKDLNLRIFMIFFLQFVGDLVPVAAKIEK